MARIGIDLDGVCYPFDEAIRRYMYYRHDWSFDRMPEPTNWHFYEGWGMTQADFDRYCHESVNEGYLFRVCAPYSNVASSLDRLRAAGHSIHIVTARDYGHPGFAEKDTVTWLDKFGIPYDTITFSRDKTIVRTDWFIEDNIKNYEALNKGWCIPVLMDQPWNREAPGHYRRAKSMNDFADMITGNK